MFHIFIELFGEIITIMYSKDSLIEVNILWNTEIFPAVKVHDSYFFGDSLTIDEDSLSNSRIFHSRFGDMDCFVIQIKINDAWSDSIVF